MNAKDIVTLVEYNQWANERVMRKLNRMSHEALTTPCWLSSGTLMKSLVHLIDTEWSWRVACQTGMLPAEITEKDLPTWAVVRSFWKQEMADTLAYARSLGKTAPDKMIKYRFPQARFRTRPLWHVLMHMVNHSTHHRSEMGQYLHTLGRSPGDMDFMMFLSSKK